MTCEIIISDRAQLEIEEAANFYALHSSDTVDNFYRALVESYGYLETTAYFRIRYSDIRAISLKKFPYLLYYSGGR